MTNKIQLRTPEQFMADYTPVYTPMYPLLLGNSQSYSQQVGQLTFKRLEVMGDVRAKHVTPKDTELKQIAVAEGSKVFKKYFLANQYVSSTFQDNDGWEDVMRQVLDVHQIHMDSIMLEGDGQNNGLFTSSDANFTTEGSTEIQNDSGWMPDLFGKIMTTKLKADQVSGRKLLIVYGANVLPLYNGIFTSAARPFKSVLAEGLGPNYSVVEMPSQCTPTSSHGWMVVNLDQIKFHYTTLPGLDDQGQNPEKKYLWANFVMGSCMVDVKALHGVIKQPATVEAA